jgi:hypothetical protein
MKIWKTLLLVYRELDVRLPVGKGSVEHPRRLRSTEAQTHFHHGATERELADAIDSFRGFPGLVHELTTGAAVIDYKMSGPITRLLLSPANRHHAFGPRLTIFDPIWTSSLRLGNATRFSFSGPSGI